MGMLPYVVGYRAGYKAASAADGPGGSGYDAAYRTGMQVRDWHPCWGSSNCVDLVYLLIGVEQLR